MNIHNNKNNKKSETSLLTSCLPPLLLVTFLTACGVSGSSSDGYSVLSTEAGGPYESIGSFVLNPCTGTYLGDGVGISSAHCFEQGINDAGPSSTPAIGFGCAAGKRPGKETCRVVADVAEIAIPEGYGSSAQEQPGSDIALFRVRGEHLPRARFSLSGTFNVGPVMRIGYGRKEGLTGDLSCHIQPTSQFPEDDAERLAAAYHIRTDCGSIWGDSGGPLMDRQERIIGVSKGARVVDGKVVETYAVPMTPVLQDAVEQFKKGELPGSMNVLPSGVRVTTFPYSPAPVSYK